MILRRKTSSGKTRYGVRVERGKSQVWVGTYETLAEARKAEAKAREGTRVERMTCDAYADHWLEGYKLDHKLSSYDTARSALRKFKEDFRGIYLDRVGNVEAEKWARANGNRVPVVVTMMNSAVKARLLDRNPFVGLSRKKGPGRKNLAPLTVAEVDELAQAALETNGPILQALIYFLAYSGVRIGEAFALEWPNIDADNMRIHVERRFYRGHLDLPKSGKARTIVLTPQARDAVSQLERHSRYVFTAKKGGPFSQSLLNWYWGKVTTKFGRHITPHELRHFAGHFLYVKKGLPDRVVAVQLGHSDGGRLVRELYGHGDVGALEEIDTAFEADNVLPFKRRETG